MNDEREMEILYRDTSLMVVNKPSGLLSVPGKGPMGKDSVTGRVRELVPECIAHPEVHRLDMDTSGLMVLALEKEVQAELSRQFREREIFKRYIALLDGLVTAEKGRIELPFRLDPDRRPLQAYDEEFGKVGVTDWSKVGVEEARTRVEFYPITGRTHQLRVHSAHAKGLGFPIVGDTLYGGHPRHGELCLHATELHFYHPVLAEKMQFVQPPLF